MGASSYAYAGYGLIVNSDKLYKERQKPGCKCYNRGWGSRFCPNCGAPAFVGQDVPVDGYNPEKETLCGFKVISFSYEDEVFIAIYCMDVLTTGTDWKNDNNPPDFTTAKAYMKEKLESLGIWDDKEFGLHCIGHLSC